MIKKDKKERQKEIAEIVSKSVIDSQEELLQILAERGFEVTQATLSRDFRELKIAKTPDDLGRYVYRLPSKRLQTNPSEKRGMMSPFMRQGIMNIEFSGQMAMIKTPEGYAQGIARDIDVANISGIMGTIAGYDTVFVVLRENADKTNIMHSLKIIFTLQ